jgi:hypothetical protein
MNAPKNQKRLTPGDYSALDAACRLVAPSATGLMGWVGAPGSSKKQGKGAAVPVNRLEPLSVIAAERGSSNARFRPITLHQHHLLVEVIDEPDADGWIMDPSGFAGPSNSSGWSI